LLGLDTADARIIHQNAPEDATYSTGGLGWFNAGFYVSSVTGTLML